MGELAEKIASEIQKRGPISFARFMELALYCPVYGYYEKEGDNIGRHGDYYTSVSVGSLFGELLAWQFAKWLAKAAAPGHRLEIIEAGAHRGDLAKDILRGLREYCPGLATRVEYWLVEPSARRRAWQRENLSEFTNQIRWVPCLSELARADTTPSRIIFSNELLDAFPVHRFGWDAQARAWFEWGVVVENGQFAWRRMPAREDAPQSQGARELLEEILGNEQRDEPANSLQMAALVDVLPDGFILEVSPAAVHWWQEATGLIRAGKLVALDYGGTAEQLLAPEGTSGTLRGFSQHRFTQDILDEPGERDITADVNFSALMRVGEAAGFKTDSFVTQEQFLVGVAKKISDSQSRFGLWTPERTRQFQTLTHPEHLGRSFKVLIQSRLA